MKDFVTYEQPLNERMRTFLRLEVLMERLRAAMEGDETWRAHCALNSLLEIVSLVNRVDVKNDLMLELDRQAANIGRLSAVAGVDEARQHEIVERLRHLSRKLHEMSGQLAQHLVRNELLASIKQRMSIPGGTCDFDLPAYHYWLSRDPASRKSALQAWVKPFDQVMEATELVLGLVRDSAVPTSERASQGFFQQTLNLETPTQILRVRVEASLPVYPEISAGKHRFSIRFLRQPDIAERASQTDEDVSFELATCAL
ncbi:cell division protein ZapD [Acidihalobacter prosperus]|uniref:Cell division protein ZapD n=1 Tax=Acidihalobacter prosperus TaxID=160660 RepID=A0A1A6C3C3_9GAMM|nr:cell division protein ZapD [Acidihalobacter prosperus]OBS09059.1 cell division protein ZapD [Acidihalobacter prosperus]